MGIIAKTLTRGFRNSFFRNQPVHQFYGHLQAVLREISPSGELDNLFAKPEFAADAQALPAEIEWSTTLDGKYEMFKDLPPARQKEMANYLGSCLEKIKTYAEAKQAKSGKEKDYAEYLKAVAVSPDLNQIFVIKDQPVLVHWGFTCENGNHPGQGMYAGWDEFIAEIHRKAAVKADAKTETRERIVLPPEPPPEAAPEPLQPTKPPVVAAAVAVKDSATAKAAESVKDPEKPAEQKKPKRIVACGLGDYEWVKWLAIILAIIILLLLLLRFIPPQQPSMPHMPPGAISSGGGGSGGGGSGGGGSGSGGGAGGGSGSPGGSPGGSPPAPGQKCPQCGHMAQGEQSQAPVQPPSQTQSQQGATQQSNQVSPSAQQPQTDALPQSSPTTGEQSMPGSVPSSGQQPAPQSLAQPVSAEAGR